MFTLTPHDPRNQKATMGVTIDSKETPQSEIRPYKMGIPPSGTLDMNESPHLMISYLLRDERRDLESKHNGWLAKG